MVVRPRFLNLNRTIHSENKLVTTKFTINQSEARCDYNWYVTYNHMEVAGSVLTVSTGCVYCSYCWIWTSPAVLLLWMSSGTWRPTWKRGRRTPTAHHLASVSSPSLMTWTCLRWMHILLLRAWACAHTVYVWSMPIITLISMDARESVNAGKCGRSRQPMLLHSLTLRWTLPLSIHCRLMTMAHSSPLLSSSCCWNEVAVTIEARTSTGRAWRTSAGWLPWANLEEAAMMLTLASSHCSQCSTWHSQQRKVSSRSTTLS